MVLGALERYASITGVSWLGWYKRRHLEEATKDVVKAQHETLMERITDNMDTEYGKRFKFNTIKSREDFINSHPLTRS